MAHSNTTQYANNTLNGLLRLNDKNLADFEYSELVQPTALFRALPWYPASNGTVHKFTVIKSAPGAAFRDLNSGVANAAGQSLTRSLNLKILDASFFRDVAAVSGAQAADYLEKEAMRSLTAAFATSEYQLIKGSDNDGDGFDGLQDLASLYDGNSVNVAGSGGTRVYMMIMGEADVCGILGKDGEFSYSDPVVQRILTDVSTGAGYNAWNVDITGWVGMQVGGKYSVAFAYNIDGTSGKVVDDDLLGEIYSLFPSDRAPFVNGILMSRTGLYQLQQSRTATNPTGSPAPFPASWNAAGRDIPILVSDAVNDDESTVTTTTSTTTSA
jgi:hypothetical protein